MSEELTWIDVAMRALEILGVIAVPLALYLRSRAVRAETKTEAVIEGIERARYSAEVKAQVSDVATRKGVEADLKEDVKRVTRRLK